MQWQAEIKKFKLKGRKTGGGVSRKKAAKKTALQEEEQD